MEITHFLFKNSFSTIEPLLIELQITLKDHNVSPMFLYRHYGHASNISHILNSLIPQYAAVIQTNFDLEKLQEYIRQNFDSDFTYACPCFEDDLVNVILGIISTDIRDSYYDLSPYTNLPQAENRLYRDTGIVFDHEGLVEITDKFSLEKDSLLFDQKFVLFYSPFFRRCFSGNFTDITGLISQLSKRATVKISLDHFYLHQGGVHPFAILECDHWRGKKFNQAKLNDEHYEGVVVYGREREKYDDENGLPSPWPIIRTEFRIRNKEPGIKQIEIEEITPPKHIRRYLKHKHVNKYVHVLWNMENQSSSHLDFAIQVYSPENYETRKGTEWKMITNGDSERIKLFRTDDSLKYDEAIELIMQFFRHNEMVGQFFAGK